MSVQHTVMIILKQTLLNENNFTNIPFDKNLLHFWKIPIPMLKSKEEKRKGEKGGTFTVCYTLGNVLGTFEYFISLWGHI